MTMKAWPDTRTGTGEIVKKIENYLCKVRKVGHGYSSLSTGRMGEYRRLTHCAKQT